MKLLFLRGKVDKRTQRNVTIDKHHDMWTQLAYALTGSEDMCKILYWGGKNRHYYSDNIVEEWRYDFKHFTNGFYPDVIFCRGGFKEYDSVIKEYPNAKRIYYGAGKRTFPIAGRYDIVLIDDPRDIKRAGKYESKCHLWTKPCAENVFYPEDKFGKKYDICFPANGSQVAIKGFRYAYKDLPRGLTALNLGYPQHKYKIPKNVNSIRVTREEMRTYYSMCRVGIVPYTNYDSAPRVISEMLACGIPVIALKRVRFWHDKFCNGTTGDVVDKKLFWPVVKMWVLKSKRDGENKLKDDIVAHYHTNLSLQCAVKTIREAIDGKKKIH